MQTRHWLATSLALLSAAAGAQQPSAYPVKPVHILVGWAPGGAVDLMGRFFATRFASSLGQSFVVENRAGAASNIATDAVAKAKPDGYVLLMTSVVHSINPSLYGKLPYDPVKDFAAISPVALAPDSIAVHPSLGVESLKDLIALAKARPGQVAFASSGGGTLQHVGMVLFTSMAGIKMLDVPFNGSGPAIVATVSGQVPVLSSGYGSALPYVGNGKDKLRVLGISTAEPSPLAPGIPTIAEAADLPGYEAVAWMGLLAPAGTPAEIVNRLNAEIGRLSKLEEVRDWLAKQGLEPDYSTPAAFSQRIAADMERYGKIVREIGAKPD